MLLKKYFASYLIQSEGKPEEGYGNSVVLEFLTDDEYPTHSGTDQYRKTLGVPGVPFVFTSGISALPVKDRATILEKVKTFDDFNEGNDPYGEHDFGSFEHEGNVINWKIDYYNPQMNAHSEDPSDPFKTVRVLIVMLAEEY